VFSFVLKDGWTALMKASKKGHLAIATMLVDHGADMKTRTKVSPKRRMRKEGGGEGK